MEAPRVQTIWETYQSQGLTVLAVGAGMTVANASSWRAQYSLTYPVLADPSGAVYNAYGAGFVPHNSIVDGNMVLQYTEIGYDETEVVDMIEHLLLNIDHDPMLDSEDSVNPYPVSCSINSATSLTGHQLHWNLDGGSSFTTVPMTQNGPAGYTTDFTAQIPAQPYGTTVHYYISGSNSGGLAATDPVGAPSTLHSFYVGVDSTAPVVAHSGMVDQVMATWPPTLTATVTDNQGVDTVTLEFRINGGTLQPVPMALERNGVYSADLFGSAAVGDLVEYRFTAVDVAAAANTTVDPTPGYYDFHIVDPVPVYIFEPDGTPQSGAVIAAELTGMGIAYDMGSTLPSYLSLYSSIFACLGVYNTNHTLTPAEGEMLAEYLDHGGRLYMEGGDTWAWDSETAVHPYFNINGLADGSGDAGPINGGVGTLAEGMTFQYSGANSYMDRIEAVGGAEVLFTNGTPMYINGVVNDGGVYRTIGTSFKFAGLVDGTSPSTKGELLSGILEFFIFGIHEDGFESGDLSGWSATTP